MDSFRFLCRDNKKIFCDLGKKWPIKQLFCDKQLLHSDNFYFVSHFLLSNYKSEINKYRGVSLQCVVSKILDSIITYRHYTHNFYLKSIIDTNQNGFIKERSTTINSIAFTSETVINMNRGPQTDTI